MPNITVGEIVEGEVEGIADFGAFVKIKYTNKTGLVHISNISEDEYVKDVNDYLNVGDKVRVKITNIKEDGKIDLSWKDVPHNQRFVKQMNESRYLPEDTRKVLGEANVENFNLIANKYLDKFKNRYEFDRKKVLKKIKDKSENIFKKKIYSKVNAKKEKQFKMLKKSGYFVKTFEFKNDYRLIVGLGGANVLETNLSLHHIYGLPYIPGSSLKGLAKAYAVEKIKEDLDISYEESESILEKGKTENEKKGYIKKYRNIFGTQKKAGIVNFFDAFPFPVNEINIVIDIMTPHFKEYYGDDKFQEKPTDTEEPTPIPFLSLEGQSFKFCLSSSSKEHLDEACLLLKKGLKYLGIGAKTMVGYGYFK